MRLKIRSVAFESLIRPLAQREAYLSEVEDRAITHRSDETQFRAKLVGVLGERSYDCLLYTSDAADE